MNDDYRIVGTAGHIDHGKSALVRALTGTDPDRLQEERERGITIDLGFAHLELESGVRVGFIDVPGHEKFVKNMLAGIGGIDAVLFVVAADESVMPQTREHLAICRLLGVGDGVVAITKCDLVDDEIAELVELEVRDLLADTGLADAPIVRTSAQTGAGLADLRAALQTVLEAAEIRAERSLVRLPVDRVFTVRGFGTVVTGTLLSGSIRTGDRLELLPRGTTVTVRGLQVYGESVDHAIAGQRTAVNLQGIDTRETERGDVLASPGALSPSYLLDARLDMLDGYELEHLQRVRFHHGAVEALCRVALLDAEGLDAGGTGLVQLRLETAYACAPGDRFVIRRYSPMLTIGGGIVIDNLPAKHRRRDGRALALLGALEGAGLDDRIAAIAADAGVAGVVAGHLRQRNFTDDADVGEAAAGLVDDGRLLIAQQDPLIVVDAGVLPALEENLIAAVGRHHEGSPLEAGLSKSAAAAALPRELPAAVFDALVERMLADGRLGGSSAALALPGHDVVLDESQDRLRGELIALYDDAGLAPPALDAALQRIGAAPADAEGVVRLLLRRGELVRLRDDLVYSSARLDALVEDLRTRYGAGETFAVADFKDWTGVSRKHAIPLLEYLDQRRITRRSGDLRVRV